MSKLIPEISWYMKHMPQKIEDMIFDNPEDMKLAVKWINQSYCDGNIILFGPGGTGKTTLINILIRTIIKAGNDLYRMKTRSVKEIDEKIKPFLLKKPVKSTTKIVYIEEIDGISKEGQRTLKEDCLEKYQKNCTFLCATNHIKKIDPALLTRFTYKFHLTSSNVDGIANRLSNILKIEGCQFDESKLKDFVEKNHKKGVRDLINALQIESVKTNKQLTFEGSETSLNLEENVVGIIFNILKIVLETQDLRERQNYKILPLNTKIGSDYSQLTTILHNNYSLNFDSIYDILLEENQYLPLQLIIMKYSENSDSKKYPHLHLISCIYEMMDCCIKVIP